MKFFAATLIFVTLFALLPRGGVSAQKSAAQIPAPQDDDDDVVTITTNLVQVDAVVTDKDGKQVTDLSAGDFEIYEDERAQPITNFSYINAEDARGARENNESAATTAQTSARASLPPARVRPEDARRTIALVVDDLGLAFDTTAHVRQYLLKFVEQQMRPGDLVAVIRTSAGVGAFQQFSADKEFIRRAISRIRFRPGIPAATGVFADPRGDGAAVAESKTARDANAGGEDKSGDKSEDKSDDKIADYRENLFAVGTLGALNYVVRGMRRIPGRKSVVLLSENIRVFSRRRADAPEREYFQRLADLANRASVSIYNFDAKNLKPSGLSDEESIEAPVIATGGVTREGEPGRSVDTRFSQFNQIFSDKRRAYYETQAGLRYLAEQTGGRSRVSFERIIEDGKGYYLIGYRPDPSTFDQRTGGRGFRSLRIKVKRPGLRVRHRVGFYAVSDDALAPAVPATRENQLIAALTSPFTGGDIRVRLTALFEDAGARQPGVRALLSLDPRDLTFTLKADGTRTARIDVLALTFVENGKAIDEVNRIETVRVSAAEYATLVENGVLYSIKVPLKRAGAYQLRVGVRDAATGRTGAASEFINVPDLTDDRLALSGIIINGRAPETAQPKTDVPVESPTFDAGANPAVRRLLPGTELFYDYFAYNARTDSTTGRPRLTAQMRLLQDGKVLYEGKPIAFDAASQPDAKRLRLGGSLKLSRAAKPGEYTLQVLVTDTLAAGRFRTATQWMDFEVIAPER